MRNQAPSSTFRPILTLSAQRLRGSLRPVARGPFDKFDQSANGNTRGAFRTERGGRVAPRRAGNVEMGPRNPVGKLFQESRGGDGSGLLAAYVFDIGNIGFDLRRDPIAPASLWLAGREGYQSEGQRRPAYLYQVADREKRALADQLACDRPAIVTRSRAQLFQIRD